MNNKTNCLKRVYLLQFSGIYNWKNVVDILLPCIVGLGSLVKLLEYQQDLAEDAQAQTCQA